MGRVHRRDGGHDTATRWISGSTCRVMILGLDGLVFELRERTSMSVEIDSRRRPALPPAQVKY